MVHKLELKSSIKSKSFMNSSELTNKSSSLTSLTSDQTKSNKSERLLEPTTEPSSLPRTPSSKKSSNSEPKVSKKKNSDILNNSVEKSQNLKFWPQSLRIKLLLSSVTLQSSPLNKRSKPTRSQLKPESVPSPQLTMLSQLVQLVWIHLKSTSSTLWISQPRSSRVKFKSPKTSRSVPLERKLKLQKLPFWKSSTSSHSNMVWELSDVMTMEPFFHKKSSTLIQLHCWLPSKAELRTWLVFHWKPVIQLKPPFHLSWPTHSRTLLLFHLNQDTRLRNSNYWHHQLQSLKRLLKSQLVNKLKLKKLQKPQNHQKKKKKMPVWEVSSIDHVIHSLFNHLNHYFCLFQIIFRFG